MRSIEELLRDQLRGNDKALAVGRDDMLARVVRARRRRAATVVTAITVLTIGGAAAFAGALNSHSGQQTGSDLPARQYSAELLNALFTDPQHGFVLQERCGMDAPTDLPEGAPTPDVHADCASHLLVTADAGQTWQERTLPGDPATKDAGVDIVMGHSLMLWRDGPSAVAIGGWNRRYWTTTDQGATWVESLTPHEVGPKGSHGVLTSMTGSRFWPTFPVAMTGSFTRTRSSQPVMAALGRGAWILAVSR